MKTITKQLKPIDKKFIIHHASSLPIVTDFEIGVTHTNLIQANSFVMIITKVEFERLPYPYETDCIEYKNDTLFDCLNKCYRKKYLNEIQCIPFNNGLVTFKIDNDTLKENRFCTNLRTRLNDSNLNELSQKIKSECSVICGTPCNELYHSTKYHESYDDFDSHNRFYLSQSYFLKNNLFAKKIIFFVDNRSCKYMEFVVWNQYGAIIEYFNSIMQKENVCFCHPEI